MKKSSYKCKMCGIKVKKKFKNYKEKQTYKEVNDIYKDTDFEDCYCKKCSKISVKKHFESL